MPKYAPQPQWRQRRAAIGKKNELESELLMESEPVVPAIKQHITPPGSPTTTIAFDLGEVPEMKPLPGAWMVVGKGGRPVKASVMYDEPAPKQKKKKRNRTRKVPSGDDESPLAVLEEMPSSSKCVQTLERSMMKHQKVARSAKSSKFWIRYQQEKQMKVLAHHALLATLAADGMLVDESEEALAKMSPPSPPKQRTDKNSSRSAQARRRARFASAAARCYSAEDNEWPMETAAPLVKELKQKPDGRSRVSKASRSSAGEQSESSWASVTPTKMERDPSAKVPTSSAKKGKAKKDSKNCTVQ